jgi:hypothetical protein
VLPTKGIDVCGSVRKHIYVYMTYNFITEELPMIIIMSGSNILAATNLKTIAGWKHVKQWFRTKYRNLHQHGLDRIVLPQV